MIHVILPIHEVALRIRTNNEKIAHAIRTFIYHDQVSIKSKGVFDIEIQKVKDISRLFPKISFHRKKTSLPFYFADGGEEVFWKSKTYGAAVKINKRDRRAVVFLSDPHRSEGMAVIELAILHPLIYFTGPLGWHFIHSAAVSKGDEAILIVGPSCAGKTTIALKLLEKGYKILGDDINIIHHRKDVFHLKAFPRKQQIKQYAFSYFPELKARKSSLLKTRQNRWVMSVDDIKENSRQPSAVLKMVVFIKYRPRAKAKLDLMAPEQIAKFFEKGAASFLNFNVEDRFVLDSLLMTRSLSRRILTYTGEYSDSQLGQFVDQLNEQFEKI